MTLQYCRPHDGAGAAFRGRTMDGKSRLILSMVMSSVMVLMV
jgi:hypothetical protein